MLFLGTGAADVIPNPFCSCKVCTDARKHPEKSRLRSMLLLDEKNLIDFGPDLAAAAIRENLDLSGLERVFITHTHQDHLCLSNAGLVHMSSTREKKPLEIYLSEAAYRSVEALYRPIEGVDLGLDEVGAHRRNEICFCPVKTGETFTCGKYRVLAVETTHRASEFENGVNYLFEDDNGRKLLYACDTGIYPEETIRQLRGSKVDILMMDATWGSNEKDINPRSHLGAKTFLSMLEMMLENEIIRQDTCVYAIHINHKHDLTHEEYQQWFNDHSKIQIVVAHDGLQLEWKI